MKAFDLFYGTLSFNDLKLVAASKTENGLNDNENFIYFDRLRQIYLFTLIDPLEFGLQVNLAYHVFT